MDRPTVLITAGNTRVPIDKVRSITNIFKGRTGAKIAAYFAEHGCDVTLFTSNPQSMAQPAGSLNIQSYATYDELLQLMERAITSYSFDAIIHSAAVSDYEVDKIFKEGEKDAGVGWVKPTLYYLDHSGKVGSDHAALWMRLVPTEKIIDKIRADWGFAGKLVKFKLQVGMLDEELVRVATASMKASQADFIVANTLEGMTQRAYIISAKGGIPVMVSRGELPEALFLEVFP